MVSTNFSPSISNTNGISAKRNLFVAFLLVLLTFALVFPEIARSAPVTWEGGHGGGYKAPSSSSSKAADTDVVKRIVDKYESKATEWQSKIKDYALVLLKWFATFEVCWIGIRLAMGRENIGDAIKQLVMFILMAGFFWAVIDHYHEWSRNLIDGLAAIGNNLGAPGELADRPFKAGLDIAEKIWDEMDFFSPGESLGLVLVGLIVLFCFALIAARMVVIKCEAAIAMAAALLLVGFGGSSLTKDYGVNAIRYVLAVAFKLFTMQLVIAVGISFIDEFKVGSTKLTDLTVIIGASLVLVVLVASLPETVAGIVTGSNLGGGSGVGLGAVGAAAGGAALGAAVGGVAGAVGAGKSISAASKMANMAGATGLGKVGHMAKNLMSARQEAKGNKPTASSIMKERLATAQQANK